MELVRRRNATGFGTVIVYFKGGRFSGEITASWLTTCSQLPSGNRLLDAAYNGYGFYCRIWGLVASDWGW
jgi:hypothetical protein